MYQQNLANKWNQASIFQEYTETNIFLLTRRINKILYKVI